MSMWRGVGLALLIGLGACGNSDGADQAGGSAGAAGQGDAGAGGAAGQGDAGSGPAGSGTAGHGTAGHGTAGAGGKPAFTCKGATSCEQFTCGCPADPMAPCPHPLADCQLDCQLEDPCGQANFTGKGGFAPEPPYAAADDKALDRARCAIKGIAAHQPGKYRWMSSAATGSHLQTLHLLAGGLAWVTQENTLDSMTQQSRLGPAALKPDTYFASCTAADDPTKLFECLDNAVGGCP